MADMLQNYIDGEWVDARDGERFDVFDPATGEVIATAPDSRRSTSSARSTRPGGRSTTGRGGPARPRASAAGSCSTPPTSCVASRSAWPGWSRSIRASRSREAREDMAEVAFMFEYFGGWATKIEGDMQPAVPGRDVHGRGRSRWASPPASRRGTTR